MLNINCIFKGRIPKEQESIDDCQDQYCIKDNCLAIADGASQSFYPSIWAELLVQHFCDNPKLNEENWEQWLFPIQEIWLSKIKQRVETAKTEKKPVWVTNQNRLLHREAATSTFVGLELINEKLRLSVVGDSCFLIWQRHQDKLETYILQSSEEFDDRPEYFGSYPKDNKFSPKYYEIDLDDYDIKDTFFFLATDALAEWILKNWEQDRDVFSDLLKNNSPEEFEDAMSEARKDSELNLKNDDTTLIAFQLSKEKIFHQHPKLPNIPKSKAPSQEGAFEPNQEGAFEPNQEGDFEPNQEGDFESNQEGDFESNNPVNPIKKLLQLSKTIFFSNTINSPKNSQPSNINEENKHPTPNNSIKNVEDINSLKKKNIILNNRNKSLITQNENLLLISKIVTILFASSLLGCIVLISLLLKSRSSEISLETSVTNTDKQQIEVDSTANSPGQKQQTEVDSTANSPGQKQQTEVDSTANSPGQKQQAVPGQSFQIVKGKDIYDNLDSNRAVIKSLSNPIQTTVKELKNNLIKVETSFFIEKTAKGDCSGCALNEISIKQGSHIWKNPSEISENKVGILVNEKRFLINKEVDSGDFISIQFSGYIKKN